MSDLLSLQIKLAHRICGKSTTALRSLQFCFKGIMQYLQTIDSRVSDVEIQKELFIQTTQQRLNTLHSCLINQFSFLVLESFTIKEIQTMLIEIETKNTLLDESLSSRIINSFAFSQSAIIQSVTKLAIKMNEDWIEEILKMLQDKFHIQIHSNSNVLINQM
jgi:hypothetical protein